MNGDFTRLTFRADKHYSGVRLQQGRLLLDADWNEQVDIDSYSRETSTADTAGRVGAPLHAAGFALRPTPGTTDGWSGILGAGHFYVDGILCQNEFETLFGDQPDLPGAALPTAAGTYVAYLDVWQRHISALEEPDLLEIALGGPDTTTRTRTVWQVKLERVGDASAIVDGSALDDDWVPTDSQSTGRLRARSEPSPQSNDVCLLPPGAGFRRLENQLYRVEIHTPPVGGAPNLPTTFKWSRENASVATRLLRVQVFPRQGGEDTLLTVADAGRDPTRGFAAGNWVELVDEQRLLANQPGVIVQINGASGNRLTVSNWPAGVPRPDSDRLTFDQWQVRRWDSPNGAEPVRSGSPDQPLFVELEDGVQVEFSGGAYRTGDYWLIPARSSIGDVDWPRVGNQPVFQRRHGIEHHYAALAVLRLEGTTWTIARDLRRLFPPTTELISMTYAGGGGQQALANPTGPGLQPLAQPLQTRVTNGQWPVPGAAVRFRIASPDAAGPVGGSLQAGTVSGAEVRVLTDANGMASCFWTLDGDARHHTQRVVATLVEAGRPSSPVAFDAQLNVASLLAYTPGACVALTGVHTVQDALDKLCQTGSGREPAIHVVKVAVQGGAELANDTDVGVDVVAQGVVVQCAFDQRAGQALNPVSVNRATAYLEVELPYPLSPPDRNLWQLTSGVLGFEALVLASQVSVLNDSSIVLRPTDTTAAWLRSTLFGVVTPATQIDRILARLTLKGNYIASLPDGGNQPSHLDGDVFGSSGRERTAAILPSGDGQRGGDFEMWFWLVQNAGLASLVITPAAVVGGAQARVSITLTGPAPSQGTTLQVFVDGDPTGTVKVPTTVRVNAGARDATFDVVSEPIGSALSVSIRVVMTTGTRSESRAVNLSVLPPVAAQLTLNPSALDSGSQSQATVTLSGPAPAGGLTLRLATTEPNATSFPDSPNGTVVVAAGQSSIAVRVATNPAVGNVTPIISATPSAPGSPAQASLTIRRLTVTGPTFNPTEVIGGAASTGTLTLSGNAPANGSSIDLTAPQRLNLRDLQNQPIGTILVPAGSRSVTFRAIPEGFLSRTALPVTATLRVGAATSSGNLTVQPSVMASVSLSATSVVGGTLVNGTATLSGPAPREGANVSLSANPGVVSFRNAAGALVGVVTVPAGSTSVAFGVATQVLDSGEVQSVTIFASIAGQSSVSTALTVRGPSKVPTKDAKDNRDSEEKPPKDTDNKIFAERQEPFQPRDLSLAGLEPSIQAEIEATGRAFIQPEERPDVGAAALEQAAEEKPTEPEEEEESRKPAPRRRRGAGGETTPEEKTEARPTRARRRRQRPG